MCLDLRHVLIRQGVKRLPLGLESLIFRSKSNISSPDIIIIHNNPRVETALKKCGKGKSWSNKIIN